MTAAADAISKYTAAYYAIILGFFLTNFIIFPCITNIGSSSRT